MGPEPVSLRQCAEGHAHPLRGLHIRGLARVRQPPPAPPPPLEDGKKYAKNCKLEAKSYFACFETSQMKDEKHRIRIITEYHTYFNYLQSPSLSNGLIYCR